MTPADRPLLAIARMGCAILAGCAMASVALYTQVIETWPAMPRVDPSAEVLWIGDSLTKRMPARYQKLGVDGYQTRHVLEQLDHLEGSRARVVVVMLGVNDLLSGRSPDATAAGVAAIVDGIGEVLPGAAVLVVGILPAPTRVDEGKRHATNGELAEIPGVYYVEPPAELDVVADGLHLTPAGYAALWAEIDPVLASLTTTVVFR